MLAYIIILAHGVNNVSEGQHNDTGRHWPGAASFISARPPYKSFECPGLLPRPVGMFRIAARHTPMSWRKRSTMQPFSAFGLYLLATHSECTALPELGNHLLGKEFDTSRTWGVGTLHNKVCNT